MACNDALRTATHWNLLTTLDSDNGWLVDQHRAAPEELAAKLRSDGLGAFLDDWEAKHGELTSDELARGRNELTHQNLVVSNPEILSGEPVFVGTRITIDTILASLDAGIDVAHIRELYPIVSDQHITAARAYRAEHPTSRKLRISEMHPDLKSGR